VPYAWQSSAWIQITLWFWNLSLLPKAQLQGLAIEDVAAFTAQIRCTGESQNIPPANVGALSHLEGLFGSAMEM
jgi:hypothetical protein